MKIENKITQHGWPVVSVEGVSLEPWEARKFATELLNAANAAEERRMQITNALVEQAERARAEAANDDGYIRSVVSSFREQGIVYSPPTPRQEITDEARARYERPTLTHRGKIGLS